MQSWITQDGVYYEAESKLNQGDIRVQKRPNKSCVYANGHWVMPVENDADYSDEPPQIRTRYIEQPVYNPKPQQVIQAPQEDKKKDEVTLSNSTRVLFGIKEIFMVCAIVATAAISWQDTNTRLMKLEDNKTIDSMEARIKSAETDIRALEKQTRADQQKLEQAIREIEQVIFMKKDNK